MSPTRCLTVVLIAFVHAGTLHADITVTAATDKAQYRRGEALDVSITAHNSDSAPANLVFGSSLQAVYFLDASYVFPQGGLTVITSRQIPANGSYTWTYRHPWTSYDPGVGSHSFFGRLEGMGSSRPNIDSPTGTFNVLTNDAPPASLAMDFDNVPGSGAAMRRAEELWPSGVRFRTQRGDGDHPANLGEHAGNQFLSATSTTYPPGFNLAADFDGTYTQAGAEVAAAVGVSVTMIAKDADGDVLASVTSAPMTALYDFVPLSLSTSAPIETLEWWPSSPTSAIHVDDVVVHAPEPGATVALLMLLACATTTWGRRGR